jgi:hypothetical protein
MIWIVFADCENARLVSRMADGLCDVAPGSQRIASTATKEVS